MNKNEILETLRDLELKNKAAAHAAKSRNEIKMANDLDHIAFGIWLAYETIKEGSK